MKLRTVRVQNFRSVEDSGEFSVEHQTCLVGKNEAGKTAILQALAGLNPHPATPFAYDIERDYPKRFLARYRERHPDSDAIVATTTWAIEDNESALIEAELGEGVLERFLLKEAHNLRRRRSWRTLLA
jgi:predicted ATP-dependent endonuclease of OLD family